MKKKTDPPLTKLADAAFKKAARKVIERAERTGTPVIVWKDENVNALVPFPVSVALRFKSVPLPVNALVPEAPTVIRPATELFTRNWPTPEDRVPAVVAFVIVTTLGSKVTVN